MKRNVQRKERYGRKVFPYPHCQHRKSKRIRTQQHWHCVCHSRAPPYAVCRAKSRTAENFYNTFKLFSSGTIKSLNGERDKSSPDFKKLKEGCVFRSILPPLTVPCRREQTRIQIIFGGNSYSFLISARFLEKTFVY